MREDGRKFRVMAAKKQLKTDRSLQVIFPESDFRKMIASFAQQEQKGLEGYAVAICGMKAAAGKRTITYLAGRLRIPEEADLINHSSVSVTPSGEFMEAVLAEASERQGTVLEIHTHPGSAAPTFSSVDLDHGLDNGRFLKGCRTKFSMMVIGSEGFSLMEYNGESDSLQTPQSATISIMSRQGVTDVMPVRNLKNDSPLSPEVDRQVLIWGEECQRKIDGAVAGIVGLGGTGSALLQMLARIGVRRFVLCDHDELEPSNLSRLPYAFQADNGKKKTKAAASYLKKLSKDIEIQVINDRVQNASEAFRDCDVLFGCVDNDGARLSMNELSLKYFIPYIDTGTEIFVEDDVVKDMGGQVRVVVPSYTGCLECAGAIDHDEAAVSLLSGPEQEMRAAAGYVNGTSLTPAPAVITLNTVIASLAVQEFVDMAVCRERGSAPNYLLYDATVPHIEHFYIDRNTDCPMCGRNGILGAGDLRKHAKSRVKSIRPDAAKRL